MSGFKKEDPERQVIYFSLAQVTKYKCESLLYIFFNLLNENLFFSVYVCMHVHVLQCVIQASCVVVKDVSGLQLAHQDHYRTSNGL